MEILYQDESIIAVNKPSGLLTIRDGYNAELPTVKSTLENEFGRCWIVHRLDKETSGVLLVARNETSHRLLNLDFENRRIHKTYHAIVYGIPSENEFDITFPLKVDGDRRHRTVVDNENGKAAKTSIKVLDIFNDYALVEARPFTGYTHQIRAHLLATGYPLMGDNLYKIPSNQPYDALTRTALHAYEISFQHPVSNNPMTITAPYPPDFQECLFSLKK